MSKASILQRMLGVAVFAAMFGATGAHAQSTQSSTSNSKDAAGMTKENKAGQMSPTGQNETTSVTPPKAKAGAGATAASGSSGSSASSGSSGSSDSTAASGKSASGKALGKNDQNMMRELAYANISEIEAGKLAQSKSQNDQVKQYAQKMIDDHTKAMEELQTLAQAKGVTLPKEPDAKHKAAAKMMSALSSEKFDKQYMAQGGLRDHRNTHKLLGRIQDRATDPDLKALASKTTPVVDQHLKMAQDVAGAKSAGNMSGSSMGAAGTSGTANSGSGSSGASGTSGSSSSAASKTPSGSSTSDTASGNAATGGSSAASRAPSSGTGDKAGTATDTGTNTTGTTGSK